MRVFVALGGWNHEGYAEPIGIYSSKEKAEAALKDAYAGFDYKDIVEYELDSAPR